jgi:hypothetical protein
MEGAKVKKLLIIRSASMQQLDKNLTEIKQKYPSYEIHMLTHEHSIKLVEKYESIKKIYIYPYKEGFSIKRKVLELKNERFDIILIPVTNISGAGFFNVLHFSLGLKATKRIICNLVSDMWEVKRRQIYWMKVKSILMSSISFLSSIVVGLFIIILLPLKLKSLEKKGE